MINQKPSRLYAGLSIADLMGVCKHMSAGLSHPTHGPSIVAGLSPEFPTYYAATLEALTHAMADQALAKGRVNFLTQVQTDALFDVLLLSASARQAAKAAFAGQDPLLHSEFQVGAVQPQGLRDKIARGLKLVAACQKQAEPLAAHGWPAAHTARLEAAVQKLDAATVNQDVASDAKEAATATQVNLGNTLYRMSRAIQCVAKVAFSLKEAQTNPTVMEARGLFLLGEFPPRRGSKVTLPTAANAS